METWHWFVDWLCRLLPSARLWSQLLRRHVLLQPLHLYRGHAPCRCSRRGGGSRNGGCGWGSPWKRQQRWSCGRGRRRRNVPTRKRPPEIGDQAFRTRRAGGTLYMVSIPSLLLRALLTHPRSRCYHDLDLRDNRRRAQVRSRVLVRVHALCQGGRQARNHADWTGDGTGLTVSSRCGMPSGDLAALRSARFASR